VSKGSGTTPATPWCGLLFEDAVADALGITTEFKNVLRVSAQKTNDTSYRMDYGLCESRSWEICDKNCQNGPCGIEYDCGKAQVQLSGIAGQSQLFGTKRLRFEPELPHDPNDWAKIGLEVMVKETALAACTWPTDCPGASPQPACPVPTVQQGSTTTPPKCTCSRDRCELERQISVKFDAPYCESEEE
jgi:hypothetical protein